MAKPEPDLLAAARGLIETDENLGADFIPRRRNCLPDTAPPAPISEPPAEPRRSAGQSAVGSVRAPSIPAVAPASPSFPPVALDMPPVPPAERAVVLARIDADEVKSCRKCVLAKGRKNTVFGEGDPNSAIVFVGEGPGEDEDNSGRPFVGRAGQLLEKMIVAMGLSRQQVFICNMVKCRPPGNRAPMPEEVQACWSYLVRQLAVIRPRVVVTLGNPATQGLLNTKVGITRLRGQWQQLPAIGAGLEGTPVMPTFHPSYVLRSYTAEVRGMVWSDLQKVMELVGLKKSAKP